MGTSQELTVDLISPWSTDRAAHALRAGDYCVIGLNAGTTGLDIDEKIQDVTVSTAEDAVSETLFQVILGYWMQNDMISMTYARSFDVNVARYPSEGLATAPIDVEYSFGVPVSGSYSAMALDIQKDRWTITSRDGSVDRKVKYNVVTGMLGSALEGTVFDELFYEDTESGISAIKLLSVALKGGIKIYGIDKSNIDSVLPMLIVDSTVTSEIENAVNAGNIVIIPQESVDYSGWNGFCYIVLDDQTGDGAYMISGGLAGGRMLLRMPGSYPMMQKPLLVDLQQSLDEWLKGNGSSYSEVLKESSLEGYCTACLENPSNIEMASRHIWTLIAGMMELLASNAEACPLVLAPAAPIAAEAVLATFAMMALVMSKAIEDVISRTRTREETWENFIHLTTCEYLPLIYESQLILADEGDFGYGVYLAHDLYGRVFPDDKIEITQMFNIPDKIVETYVELKVNTSRVWVTYHQNVNPVQAGVVEVVARQFLGLQLNSVNQAIGSEYHFEYCP
jgi:hypothetical protein